MQRNKVLVKYLLPSIFTNVCIFLFGIVDGIFVGNGVGTNALGAVNIVWPFVMFNYGLNVLTSIGGVTIVAIRIGKKNIEGAVEAFLNALLISIGLSLITSSLGVFLTRPIAILLGARNEYILLVEKYLFFYALFIVPSAISNTFQHFSRNDGAPKLVALTTFCSTALNIFLDWYFIFPLQLGIMGAALATGLSQCLGLIIISSHYLGKKGILVLKKFKPSKVLAKKIILRGFPEMIAQFSIPMVTLCMNYVLALNLGELGINTFAIISYVASFALSMMYGTSEGLQPLFGQSYGHKNLNNLKYYFKMGLIIVIVGSFLCVSLTNYFGRDICIIFGTNITTTNETVKAMPQFAWGFILAGVNALISSYLYSTKRTKEAIIINILHSFVINSLCILLLPLFFGESIIWFTYGISEIIILIIGVIFIKKSEKYGLIFI